MSPHTSNFFVVENTKEFVIKKLSSDSCVREKYLVCDYPKAQRPRGN